MDSFRNLRTRQAFPPNVLNSVLPTYRYTSLAELNAVLRLYNVLADQGEKTGRIYRTGGLIYRVLDENGQKVGVPIKASTIYSKPTLGILQGRFMENEAARLRHKPRLKNAIDLAFAWGKTRSVADLEKALLRERIQLVVRQNAQGVIYGLTYVDHQTKCVFNGSDLGKAYSANAIQQRCQSIWPDTTISPPHQEMKPRHPASQETAATALDAENTGVKLLQELFQPEHPDNSLPYELRQDQFRRRRKKLRPD